jgi:hypothetical protein
LDENLKPAGHSRFDEVRHTDRAPDCSGLTTGMLT